MKNKMDQEYSFALRPASIEEAGLFYSNDEQDEALGTVGHLRLDFGHGFLPLRSTCYPHNDDQFDTLEFKMLLREFLEAMQENGPLASLSSMEAYCQKHGGAIAEDGQTYGYIWETERYRFCLRCTPSPFEYQGHLYCYDLWQQQIQKNCPVGQVTYASGEQQTFTVVQHYQWTVQAIARILKNETYTGNFLWQKSFRTSTLPRHYKINRGEKQKYLALHSHPEIIDQDMFQQVQTLLNKRKEKFFTAEIKQSPLRGYLECGCCGSAFRTRTTRGIIYHVCRTHDAGKELCQNRQIPEFTIQGSFLRLYYKLKQQGTSLLSCLLADLQAARTGKMLWNSDIVELNMQIADITRQDRLLAQLKQQGVVDPDLFISRRDALAEQLRAVKLEKERLLKSEENPTISQTRVLLETLEAAPEFLDTFDEELFREIVDKIIVESNERLRFRLINGLELTEDIERTVR